MSDAEVGLAGNETCLDSDELAALAAVIEFGSFNSAADRLHVTPSAIMDPAPLFR
jgi:hypothetical protein